MFKKMPFFVTVLLIGLIAGILIATKLDLSPESNAQQSTVPKLSAGGSDAINENVFVKVSEAVGPSVVSISTERIRKVGMRRFRTPFENDDVFDRFFRDFFGGMPEREYLQKGLGSGIIIDQRGYILTNEHVVGDADKITITLPDGREFEGEIKGKDVRSDLAIVKIDAKNIPVAILGDSDTVRIGQWAIAIGNPFGFMVHSPEPTITVGVVSAKGRSIRGAIARGRDYSNLIQTDAAINPGNSGGPLVNINGEIIGINVAIFSTTGGYQGVGFAIPINIAKYVIGQLIEGKEVLYGWLGVNIQEIDQELADYFGLPDTKGVLVANALAGSPAEKGGLKEGDVIRTYDGKQIKNLSDLVTNVGHTKIGKKVKMDILRDKRHQTLTITIGKRPEDIEKEEKVTSGKKPWRGLEVASITQALKEQYRLTKDEGVVVVKVVLGSSAGHAGLKSGDIIDRINNVRIKNMEDYEKVTSRIGQDALVRTQRGYAVIKVTSAK